MAEGTVGVVQLDVEFSEQSIQREIKVLRATINRNIRSMFGGMTGEANNFIKNSIGRMTSGMKSFAQTSTGASSKATQAINRMNKEYEKTEEQIKKIQNELSELDRQRDTIISRYSTMPPLTGMDRHESIEQMLETDKEYQKLSIKAEELDLKLQPLIERQKELATEIKRVGDSAEETGKKFSFFGRGAGRAGKDADKASEKTRRLGNEMKSAGVKSAGFAAMINRSFRTILRRIFIYSLILKGIRGIMSHIGAALKTNRQFVNSLNTIKTNLLVAFQPIYSFILPALNALMKGIATVTTYIASAISALFGTTYKQSFGAAKSLESAKKGMTGYGKAAKKAAKDSKLALAGFDEIQNLDFDKGVNEAGAGGGGADGFDMAMPDTSTIDLSGLERFKAMLEPTIEALGRLRLALVPLKDFAVQGLKDFYNEFLVPVGAWTFGEGLPRFIDALANGLMAINWPLINEGLKELWQSLTPFAINVGEGLLWFWENVLVPLGVWTMNEIVPIFLDMMASAIDIVNNTIEALKPLWTWAWENFFQPIARWTGGAVIIILEGLAKALKGISDWIKENKSLVETMAVVIGSFMLAWKIVDAARLIGDIVGKLGGFISVGMTAIKSAGGLKGAIGALVSPAGLAIAAIGAIIAIGVLLWKNWDRVKEKAGQLGSDIKTKFNQIKNFITNPIKSAIDAVSTQIDRLKGFFSKLSLKIPKPKIPKFSLTGNFSLMPPSVPRISVDWYDKGGIFTGPQIIGVGEKRPEFVGALDDLREIVRDEILGVMSMFGELFGGNDEEGDLVLEIDGDEFARIAIRAINKRRRKAGLPLLEM